MIKLDQKSSNYFKEYSRYNLPMSIFFFPQQAKQDTPRLCEMEAAEGAGPRAPKHLKVQSFAGLPGSPEVTGGHRSPKKIESRLVPNDQI